MPNLRVIVEGQSEERLVKDVLAPHLGAFGVWATPTLVGKTGGGGRYQPYRRDVILSLKQSTEWYVTTMIDLYALPADFPQSTVPRPGPDGVDELEAAFDADIRGAFGDVHPWRFIPYLQRHELEALLFVDPGRAAEVICPGDPAYAQALQEVRAAFPNPEDINDGSLTAPSKRLGAPYRKVRHATRVIADIQLGPIRATCPRFDAWVSRLEALGPLPTP
jgi:hypothetical protein